MSGRDSSQLENKIIDDGQGPSLVRGLPATVYWIYLHVEPFHPTRNLNRMTTIIISVGLFLGNMQKVSIKALFRRAGNATRPNSFRALKTAISEQIGDLFIQKNNARERRRI